MRDDDIHPVQPVLAIKGCHDAAASIYHFYNVPRFLRYLGKPNAAERSVHWCRVRGSGLTWAKYNRHAQLSPP